jgi:DNA-binding FadR family transcriptional regulator
MERDHEQGFAPTESDAAFHQALLGASHNRFLIQFGKLLEEFFRDVRQRYRHDDAVAQRTLEEHRQIVIALRRGHVAQAERLMEAHLDPRRKPPASAAAKSKSKSKSKAVKASPSSPRKVPTKKTRRTSSSTRAS